MRVGLPGCLARIAREGSYTTGVLSHYFADKSELISACFEWTMRTWLDRVEGEIGRIHLCERLLNRPLTPTEQLASRSLEDLIQLAEDLQA